MGLTASEYQKAADTLGCEPAALRAVAEVESAGSGFLPSGKPKILFEAHYFSKLTAHRYDKSHPTISSRSRNRALYKGGEREWMRFEAAAQLNRGAAIESCSWGGFQIMGSHWHKLNYASAEDFYSNMLSGEIAHLDAFVRFIKANNLTDELQRKDWTSFARQYNGPLFAANNYDEKMARAYRKYAV